MSLFRVAPFLGLLLVAGGCRRESEISVYRVPKEAPPMPTLPSDPHAGMNLPGAGGGDPHAGMSMPGDGADPHAGMPGGGEMVKPMVEGEVPDHWKPAGGSSMRLASYRAEGDEGALADISLVVLAGGAGGVLDNVNRWRTQIGLEPVDEAGLAGNSEKRTTPVGEAVVVDLVADAAAASATDGRIVAAIIPLQAEAWFYKMRGNPEVVGREKEAFVRWVETAKVKVEIPDDPAPMRSPHGPAPGTAAPVAKPAWTVPATWQEKAGDSLRVGSFAGSGGTEVTVIRLGGDGGGDLPNVNRWRGQIGLEPLATLDGAVREVQAGDAPLSLVDMAGAEQRTLAAWALRGDESWFFKLTGPTDAVEQERAAFLAFLGSVKFEQP